MNIAVLVLAVLFAVAGYQEAQRFAKQHGSTPWRWDPWVWAIVMFLSWVIGLILLAIAERQGRKRGAHTPLAWSASTPTSAVPGWSAPVTPAAAVVAQPAGQWAADPTGRNQYRWWDGQVWTAHVSTNGATATDPI